MILLIAIVGDNLLVETGKIAEPLAEPNRFLGVPMPLELKVVYRVGLTMFICHELISKHAKAGKVQPIVPHVQYSVYMQLHLPGKS